MVTLQTVSQSSVRDPSIPASPASSAKRKRCRDASSALSAGASLELLVVEVGRERVLGAIFFFGQLERARDEVGEVAPVVGADG